MPIARPMSAVVRTAGAAVTVVVRVGVGVGLSAAVGVGGRLVDDCEGVHNFPVDVLEIPRSLSRIAIDVELDK